MCSQMDIPALRSSVGPMLPQRQFDTEVRTALE
jgi:hypothetical protein